MKIKLAICISDTEYAGRLEAYFLKYYKTNIEMFTFSSQEKLGVFLQDNVVDVALLDEEAPENIDFEDARCIPVYLVENASKIDNSGKVIYIEKYQRANQIYQEIVHEYSEKASDNAVIGGVISSGKTMIYAVSSVTGGAGASTQAAAYAIRSANQGKKVLYLNLEDFGCTEVFFDGGSRYTFEEVLLSLQSRNMNKIEAKLESTVSKSSENVYYFASCKNPLDMGEINSEQMVQLLTALRNSNYDNIVIDCKIGLNSKSAAILKAADQIIFVSKGDYISSVVFDKIYMSLRQLDRKNKTRIIDKLAISYNMCEEIEVSTDRVRDVGRISTLSLTDNKEVAIYMGKNQRFFMGL